MSFPDQSHINRVRGALWQRSGGASVMVGSGFSRNASKARPDADTPPMWRELTRTISHRLYPQGGYGNRQGGAAEVPESGSFPRLAQEYGAAFGRGELNRLLQSLVRDDDLKPEDVHGRLLRLPWRDVFTTNWDTLLERSLIFVPERKYSIVRNKDEIPLADQPRIIKLHGSFPAHFPLTCTEEDYRTYPAKFAPFVNTVQQAMMETVFCLIGFSGDDPNFLHWSGWVRDNMGASTPKIYLAGWLDLPPHRRRMLEDGNVVPIDLASHPKANKWPEHQRHDYATNWILHTLERGRPYEVTDWPAKRTWPHPPILDDLQPIMEVDPDEPKKELWYASEGESEDLPERIREIINVWAHNRSLYPGWLAAPASVRQDISSKTNDWEPCILSALPHFVLVQRLNAIRELVWRREILLDPISPELESAAQDVLQQIDCQARTIGGVSDAAIDWSAAREACRSVAVALVTVARHKFDHEAFKQRIEALNDFRSDDLDIAQRIHHERCLWAIYSMDFETLAGLLKVWPTENCDPIWMVRKAAILVETNRIDDAVELFDRALLTIREIPDDGRSVAGPSREGWALWLAWALEWMKFDWNEAEKSPYTSSLLRRWRELASMKCDARSEGREYANAMGPKNKREDAPPFDLEIRTRPGLRFSNAEYNRWVTARRAIRLSEVTGLPTSGLDILKLAADELSASEPEMAVRLILRTLNYDGDPLLKRILSRPRVAMMPADLAKTLAHLCSGIIEYALPRISASDAGERPVFWLERMRVATEVLSRLVVRLEPDRVDAIFNKALQYYRSDCVARDVWLADPVRSLLTRSWEALPEDRRPGHVLDFLSAPIVGMDNFTDIWSRYPDPGEFLQGDLLPPIRTSDTEDRWQEIVRLLVRGLHAGGEARKRASLRIAPVVFGGRLKETESSQVAQAFWSENYTGPSDLPGETSLYDWAFLLLPAPKPGLAEQRFRQKWLTSSNIAQKNAPSLADILWQVGIAISGLKVRQHPLVLSENERSYLIEVIQQWSDTSMPGHAVLFVQNQLREPIHHALDGLRSILAEIQIPKDIAEKLYEKAQSLNESGIPAFRLIAGLLKAMPNRFDELALTVRVGLVSEEVDLAKGATAGLYHWLTTSVEISSQIQSPPDDLVREIGIMIATRRKVSLGPALQIAKWVFDEGSDEQKEAIRRLALQGLDYLSEELRYDRKHDQGNDQDSIDVPLLRWRSAQLALSMAKRGFEDDPIIARWLEIVKTDPLPEVRYAKGPTSARQREDAATVNDELDSQTE